MKASKFFKHLFYAIMAVVNERYMAMRHNTSAMWTRHIISSIFRNKNLSMSAINRKIHTILGGGCQDDSQHCDGNGGNHLVAAASSGVGRKSAMLQNLPSFMLLNRLPCFAMGGGIESPLVMVNSEEEKDEGKKGVTNQLQLSNAPSGSVIDLAHNAAERGGMEFSLEDEIDHVADMFIRRFHDQMKVQRLESLEEVMRDDREKLT